MPSGRPAGHGAWLPADGWPPSPGVGARSSLQHDGYERLDDQLITQHTGRAENTWIRRHQARARWYHKRARLARDTNISLVS